MTSTAPSSFITSLTPKVTYPSSRYRRHSRFLDPIEKAFQACKSTTFKLAPDLLKDFYREMRHRHPNLSVIACHVKYSEQLKGIVHRGQHEVAITKLRPIGFDFFVFESGTFKREGDGQWENWAYEGRYKTEEGRSKIVFK